MKTTKIKTKNFISGWKSYLSVINEVNEGTSSILDIKSQVNRAVDKILEVDGQKLKIVISKEDNHYDLSANIVDAEKNNFIIDEVAYISFLKLPGIVVKDKEDLNRSSYMIDFTEIVKYGLGPLMYDLIMEFASRDDSVLCSDRMSVSDDAKGLWQNYLYSRNDVNHVQLDIRNNHLDKNLFPNLTPEVEDDQYQNVAIKDKGEKWFTSPFSKGYYKSDNYVTQFIKNSELFIYKEDMS